MDGVAVRMMSWNIRHARGMDGRVDLHRIVDEIRQIAPDIIALQEVDRFRERSGNVDQIRQIADELNMHWCYAASIKHGYGEYGNAIASKAPIVRHHVLLLPGGRERRSLLEAEVGIGTVVPAVQQAGSQPVTTIRILTTHLGVGEAERRMQAPLLLGRLAQVQEEGNAVLAGDFNVESTHPLVQQVQQLGWSRLCQSPPAKATLTDGSEIDLMFVYGKGKRHSPLCVIDSEASDHCPIVADFVCDMLKWK